MRAWKVGLVAALLSSPLVLGIIVALLIVANVADQQDEPATGGGCGAQSVSSATAPTLDAEQAANAAVLVAEGKAAGIPAYGWVVGISAALRESGLRNLDHGEGTSVGLLQLIDTNGTREQRLDPHFSAAWFYRGLKGVPGWEQMPVTVAAQRVQRSAYPNAYAEFEGQARAIVEGLSGGVALVSSVSCGAPMTGTTCPANVRSAVWENRLTTDAVQVARCMYATFGADPRFGSTGGYAPGTGHVARSDHYTGRAIDLAVIGWGTPAGTEFGDAMANWAVANHNLFHIKQVIWNAKIIDFRNAAPAWRPYQHPCGCNDPNLQHLNHVHVGVFGLTGAAA